MAQWISTSNFLVLTIGTCRPVMLEKGTEKYKRVLAMLANDVTDEVLLPELDLATKIESYVDKAGVADAFDIDRDNGIVMIDGREVHDVITDRIIDFAKRDLPYLPLFNFWRNVQSNPSEESRQHLFLFLNANKMIITHDGCFLAYKGVNKNNDGNLVDAHSGVFCNNIGAVVCMPREKVNPDRMQTCSEGLHVAAFDYVWGTYNDSTLIEVKVNPRDVVAVPRDYDNQKMRVCRYEVVALNPRKERNVVNTPLLEKEVERGLRKNSKKAQKVEKAGIKQRVKEEHAIRIDELKHLEPGQEICLSGLTANEIIDVTSELLGNIGAINVLKNMNRKNKSSIVKKATEFLQIEGFIVHS